MLKTNEDFMRKALELANEAFLNEEVPIGAIIVNQGEIIAVARNEREEFNRATAHAEIIAIEKANKALNSWRLDTCTMYVTIEPCPMCAGAIIQSRIKEVYYGARDPKTGSHESVVQLFDEPFNHKVNVTGGILEKECGEIVTKFFQKIRAK